MRQNTALKVLTFAIFLFLSPSLTYASEWSGHLSGLVGLKILDSDDWPDLDTHLSMGIAFDIRKDSWPISIALDVMDTDGNYEQDDMEDLGHSTECHFGVRKLFMYQNPKIQPYIGGGVSFMSAEQEYQVNGNKTKEDDHCMGGWLGAGIYFATNYGFTVGLDVRYSQGEVTLFDHDRAAGGFQTFVIVGIQL